jgi:hypothetical protein
MHAIELVKNGLKDCGGTVEHPKEFNKLSPEQLKTTCKEKRKGIS